ncbi:GNAT family N-acetyltransferase [Chitiniphilus purpureus]|uniref:GNAT family N-acetyltransferase n=1 Tax=Chitiniphilus purpureus TaxID=2981137 RepID=A0ABY6DQG7_9NEIS|nr:GNAT family N-acetyltransferase [Chitiniphilus sp. CD1]UXY15731.1 GNAT family N-acetyltransferase [Chitiniphilus sp. CD1]
MGTPHAIRWRWRALDGFDAMALFEYLRLRQQVFIVEQRCIYPDLDDCDPPSLHLTGHDAAGRLVACLRLVPPGRKYPEPSIGRVVVCPTARGGSIGHALVAEGLAEAARRYPGMAHRIGAQAHLAAFYGRHGFVPVGEVYDEDGIDHVDMLRRPDAALPADPA